MRAIIFETHGSPDVLQLSEVAPPEPGPGQVRVAIHAAGTNPVDAGNRRDGSWAGLQLPAIPGYDASGTIDAVGPGVTAFARGDEVFYMADFLGNSHGTYAEYHVVNATLIAHKPKNLTHIEAAALPLAAGTAYEMVIRRLALTRGEWVLLYGAAGGVGSLALQMAAAQGARVIAIARAHHHALLQDLGAIACIDYTTQDILAKVQAIADGKVDGVIDCVGGETLARSLPTIKPYGRAASIVGLTGNLDLVLDMNLTLHGVLVRPDQTRLVALSQLISAGTLRPIVDQVLPLEEAAQAHRRLETHHGRGKIVLAMR
ncbi:MAG TPA: NADP-dependent oxidoreductase [Ktedonobacteraceae bacterium]